MATGTKGLMLWCKNITANYGEDVEIKNMASSWKNGLAFCAILHHYRPDLIKFEKLSKENVAVNNELAFRIAEDELGIPALLDVEDMVNMRVPDRLSIMTYVSQYYNYFKNKVPGEIVTHRIPSKKRQLDDKTEEVPAKVTPSPGKLTIRNASQMSSPAQSSVNQCFLCGKTVYLMERLSVEGKLFHRVCFKCTTCGVQLKTSTYDFDKTQQKFYCDKHFKNRGKNEPTETSPTTSGLSNIQEDVAMSDESKSSISNSPFIRNELSARTGGARPVSSPADLQWEKTSVIKSKKEDHKAETKTKEGGKSFFGSVLSKKKSQNNDKDEKEFANPAYQQHLDLSNYMNQLDAKNAENKQIESVGSSTKDKDSKKSPKKKLVLKIKNKKKKKDKDDVKENDVVKEENEKKTSKLNKNLQNDTIENVSIQTTTAHKINNYENIDDLSKKETKNTDPRFQDDKVIYDNSMLCSVITDDNQSSSDKQYVSPSNLAVKNNPQQQEIMYTNLPLKGENNGENANPLYLAARNRLRSSGRRQDTTGENENPETQYTDIRSNLRKVKSSEVVSKDASQPHPDSVGQTFIEARSKLHRTGFAESVDGIAEISNEKDTSKNSDSSIEYVRDNNQQQDSLSASGVFHTPLAQRESATIDKDPVIDSKVDSDINMNEEGDNPFLTPEVTPEPSPTLSNETSEKANPFGESSSDSEDETSSPIIPDGKLEQEDSISRESPEDGNPFDDSSSTDLMKSPSPTHNEVTETSNPFDDTSSFSEELESTPITSNGVPETTNPFDDTSSEDESKSQPSKNPFEDSSDEEVTKGQGNTNPFLDSSEDLLFESDESSEFDESNPFAEDVKDEQRNTIVKKQKQNSFNRNTNERRSLKESQELEKRGIDESNPFADDILEEVEDDDNQHQKLSKQVSIHVPVVKSHLPQQQGNKKMVLKTKNHTKSRPVSSPVLTGVIAGVVPPSRQKKRAAPKPPQHSDSPSDSPKSTRGTLKKRQAPARPSVLPTTPTETTGVIQTDETSTETVLIAPTGAIKTDESGTSLKSDTDSNETGMDIEEASEPSSNSISKDLSNAANKTPEELADDENTASPISSTPTKSPLEKRVSEKRKAPVRPNQPYKIDEEAIMKGVALRDKQPNRAEMETELEYLEIRQRELEMEGVVMEKKLRDCSSDEPEEAYLLTWFELVNQKNLLLRRENELIYLCQEQDFLRNQRRAEFELRQLMNKPESKKTIEDRMREDELLADILNLVTRRSHIVDQMDEDRLREYEEDREITSMMEAQGLTSPGKTDNSSVGKPADDDSVTSTKGAVKTSKGKAKKKDKGKNKSKDTSKGKKS